MLLFSKRRMISMLRLVKPTIPKGDLKHLAFRLDNGDNKYLQGAWELAVLWALISEFGSDADPRVEERQGGRPDCRVHLNSQQKLMMEVYTPTGDPFEFRSLLDPITRAFYSVVDRCQPGSSPHLNVTYHEWSKPVTGGSLRGPSVSSGAAQDIRVISQLERFWASGQDSIRITAPHVIDATFTRTPYRFHGLNYRCQIPRKPQFVHNNLTGAMHKKAMEQLIPFREDHVLGLIVCDGGTEVVSNARPSIGQNRATFEAMAYDVIRSSGIDFVVSIGRQDRIRMDGMVMSSFNRKKELAVEIFFGETLDASSIATVQSRLEAALHRIPVPLRPPHQVKSLQSQIVAGATMKPPMKGASFSSDPDGYRVRVSARALVSLITGQMSPEEFRGNHVGVSGAVLSSKVVKAIRLLDEEDQDDDFIEITVSKDELNTTFKEIANKLP